MLEAELLSRAHSLALWGLGLTAGRLPWSCRVCQGAQLRAALEIFPFLETFADLEEKKKPITTPTALSSHQCSPGSVAGKEPYHHSPSERGWRRKPGPLSSCMFQTLLAGDGHKYFYSHHMPGVRSDGHSKPEASPLDTH